MPHPSPSHSDPKLIAPLTSLRAFAALYVVLFHYGNSFISAQPGVPDVARTVLGNGRMGVAFFFVLSGFILACVYHNRFGSSGQVRRYAVARFARVYPVYLLALVWTLLLGGALVSPIGWRWLPQFFCLQSWVPYGPRSPDNWNTPAWTLSAEAFFYLVFPFVAVALRRMSMAAVFMALVALMTIVASTGWAAIGYERYVVPGLAGVLPLAVLRLPEFLYGVVLGHLSARIKLAPSLMGVGTPLLVFAILASLSLPGSIAAILLVLLSGLLIWTLAAEPSSLVGRALTYRPLVLLGGASYSMYILQTPAHETVRLFLGDETAAKVLFYPILVGLSILVFVLIEEPTRERIRRSVRLKKSPPGHILDS